MKVTAKIFFSVLIFLIVGLILTVLKETTGRQDTRGGGPFGLVIIIAMTAAIRAIWKYKGPEEQKDSDDIKLDKE